MAEFRPLLMLNFQKDLTFTGFSASSSSTIFSTNLPVDPLLHRIFHDPISLFLSKLRLLLLLNFQNDFGDVFCSSSSSSSSSMLSSKNSFRLFFLGSVAGVG
uniref:Uncharacterized protein n=1 Tax=Opuntia streptacantha TaxID=393608 RepID=A0A7C8ZXY6_OPUST